jgi:carboxyl-terminal processing protease
MGSSMAGAANWRRRLLALVVALLGAACAGLPARPPAGAAPDLPADTAPVRQDGLSPAFATEQQRLALQAEVVQIVAERYFDPQFGGVDWAAVGQRYAAPAAEAASDAELYLVLKTMVRELNDSHTRVLTPLESLDRRRYASLTTGAVLAVVEGRLAVIDVDADSPAARAGLRRGDVIAAIDGQIFDEAFFAAALAQPPPVPDIASLEAEPALADEIGRYRQLRAVRQALLRPPDAPPPTYRIGLDRAGKRHEVVVGSAPLVRPPEVRVLRLRSGVAVLRLNHFTASYRNEVARALRSVADAPALVIDLRGNPGGDYSQYLWMASQFFDTERSPLTLVTRSGNTQRRREVDIAAGEQPYLKPLAVLLDRRSASAAELLAVTLFEQRGALLVGESSCGCVVGVRNEFILPGGGGLRVAETGFVSAGGRRLEGQPLLPTHYVPPTLADLQADRDRAVAVAERALLGQPVH